ncbi:BsuPI-related putative proteinase inhibitor [Gracilibacillus sp. YIM 98692]|uniref:BsuPI-related putative proteinase inhibitor n=1 Tax=Gracilibacillus sp. YIM 98692 TaxID=2663532 RepID=UPI0013D54F04|nr:BsuPI-related putative proteinase inhibitor [Gracilibacillus sp. YIM 98692]
MKQLLRFMTISIFGLLIGCGTGTSEDDSMQKDEPNTPVNSQPSEEEDEKKEDSLDHLLFEVDVNQTADGIRFDFSLTNQSDDKEVLTFPSGKQYEIIVSKDEEKIYQYSEGKMFTEALVEKEIGSGETMVWQEVWKPDHTLETGTYHVEMTLLPARIDGETIEDEFFQQTTTLEIKEMTKNEEAVEEPFRGVTVQGEKGQYIVEGEIHGSIGKAYYEVEDGHHYLIEQTPLELNDNGWQPFSIEISISEEDLPTNGTLILFLYNEDRSVQLPVELEQLQQ